MAAGPCSHPKTRIVIQWTLTHRKKTSRPNPADDPESAPPIDLDETPNPNGTNGPNEQSSRQFGSPTELDVAHGTQPAIDSVDCENVNSESTDTITRRQANPDSLAAARAAAAIKRERDGRLERLDPIEKARKNPKSRRLAVNAKCYDCEGEDADPCVQWRIGNCTVPACPLYPVRPYQHLFGTSTPSSLL